MAARRNIFFITLFCVAVCAVSFIIVRNFLGPGQVSPSATIVPQAGQSEPLVQRRWGERIDVVGAAGAYEEFKKEYGPKPFEEQHLAAHLFGAELYRKVGVRGIAVCDTSFAFGCFHSFFGRALADLGTGAIAALDAECAARLGDAAAGCQHGIGHGIMEYYGSDLGSALTACHSTKQKNPLYGCSSGVFMEYNVPILIDGDSVRTEPRKFSIADPFEPCRTVPDDFQESCHYELPQWWSKYVPEFKKIGQLCAGALRDIAVSSCYKGIGNIVGPVNNYKAQAMIADCNELPGRAGVVLCLSTAAWGFHAIPELANHARELCAGFTTKEQELCPAQEK